MVRARNAGMDRRDHHVRFRYATSYERHSDHAEYATEPVASMSRTAPSDRMIR